jgi:hypothetical protein
MKDDSSRVCFFNPMIAVPIAVGAVFLWIILTVKRRFMA